MNTQIERQEGEALLLKNPHREGTIPRADKIGTQTVQHLDESTLPWELRVAAISAIQQNATEDYAVLPKDGYYEATNAQHELHASFFPTGVGLTSTHEMPTWRWGMQLTGYGYGEKREHLAEAVLSAEGNRIEYRRNSLTEWYLNGPLGLEQGFTLHAPPGERQANEPLMLDLEFQSGWTLELGEDRQHLILKQEDGTQILHYGHLYVTDAKKRLLPVQLECIGERADRPQLIRIRVDDRTAEYPIVIDPLIQQQQGKVNASDGAARNLLGESVAIYGDTAVVGSYGTDLPSKVDAGAAYVFVRNAGVWTQQQKLTASDAAAGDFFGNCVAIYGDTIAVGADQTTISGKIHAGAVYVFVRDEGVWTQQQKLITSDGVASDFFGIRCAIYDDTIIGSASSADLPGKSDAGAAYIFTRNAGVWTQQQKLTASDSAAADFFSSSVDIYLDTAIVGCGSKGVYVYTRSAGVWTQQQKLVASDGVAGTGFGYSARINADTIIVGAGVADLPGIVDAGAAYVFVRTGTTWTQQQKLTASDAAAGDSFGRSVDISGNTALIGAAGADLPSKTNAGAAYVFARNGSVWTQTDKVTASDATANDALGYFVGLNGNTAILGAPTDDAYNNSSVYNRVGSAYLFILNSPAASPNSGAPDSNLSWAGEVHQEGSIALRTGEKVETATDMVVYTMVGAMDFTRTYRQAKRSIFQFMGLGWQHSHAATLTKPPGTPNTLIIQMPNGGELNLTETTPGSNTYWANGGSDAVVTFNVGTSQYTLVASDKSQYIFNLSGQLIQRIWPPFGANAANWVYTYDGSGHLISVEDKVDSTALSGRKLIFAYISNPGQYNNGKLWRIGDQDTTNLTTSPTGRYVEFTYTPQKNAGVTIGSPEALLKNVRDALGNVWTYRYYGQNGGESDATQLDFLVEIISPSVDTSGDGVADSTLSLEQLTYTTSGTVITNLTKNQGNAAISTAYAFQPGGQNTTTETVAGKTGTHSFDNGVYSGFTDPAGNADAQSTNLQYRPETVQNANDQLTLLTWGPDGKFLQNVTDALGNLTRFSYNGNDTLNFVQDAQGRKTKYSYGDAANPLLPTVIKFLDTNGTTVLRWQTFSYDTKGRMLTAKLMDPANGTTIMQEIDRAYYTVSGNGYGLVQTETVVDPITPANNSTTTFTYDSKGRVIKTQKTSMFGCCQFTYTVYDDTDHVVATVNSSISQTPPTTRAAAVALYDSANPDKNRVTSFYYDTLGRRIGTVQFESASYAVANLTVYDALGRVIRTIGNFVLDVGISNPYTVNRASFNHGTNSDQNLITDSFYNSRGMLRKQIDPLDNVTLYGYDDAGRLVKTIRNAATPNYNNDYTGVSPDPSLASYSANGNADQDIVSTQAYDKAGNLVKMVDPAGVVSYKVYDALNRVVKVVSAAKDAATISLNVGDGGYVAANDPRSVSYTADSAPDRDLIETTQYDKMGRVIKTQRLLENRPTAEWETTLYGYNGLGQPVKVIKVASNAAYNIAADPTLASYSASANADQDIVTRTAYDKAERVMYSEDNFGQKTWTGYDGLSRQVKNVVNAVGTATDGSATDPRSASYVPNAAVDKDLVLVTTYNSDGRVQSVTDALGRITRYSYDTVGRVTNTVQNFIDPGEDPSLWVYVNGWKKSDGVTAISNGSDNDQNIVSRTIYDGKGRVSQTIDHRNNVTLTVYDTLDRPVKTITNYVVQGASQPANWVWSAANNRWENGSGAAISFGTDNDQNRITSLTYDLLGRALRMRDAAGIETRYTLDLLGRRTQTIASYVNGVFSSAAPDEDLISTSIFNKTGQVISTTDVRGTQTAFTYDKRYRTLTLTRAASTPLSSLTYTCYDKAGRVQRTIQNWSNTGSPDAKDANGNWTFVPASNGSNNDTDLTLDSRFDKASRPLKRIINYRAQGTTNPSNWIWSTANSRWENGAGVAITFGTNIDQNLINLTSYYKNGQVESMTDAEGVVTKLRYDLLRRQTRQVQAWVDQTEDPALWVWDAVDLRWEKSTGNVAIVHGTNNDQNIISNMTYDKGSRVLNQRDPRGNVTTFAYDQLNRRKSLTNPLSKVWSTVYADLPGAGVRATTTYPGITGATNYTVQQDADRLGRLLSLQYGDPTVTPDVKLGYDAAGNRSKMSEYAGAGFTSRNRETTFSYDKVHRLSSAGFDNDGNGSVDETVSYQYDAGGLRTRLTLPGSLNVTYTYDARGRLISLTDWDSQSSQMAYDLADRHLTTNRANQMQTEYQYDAGSRVRLLKHTKQGAASVPSAAVLDDFNRADNASLGANWSPLSGASNLDLNSNQCRNPAASGTLVAAANYYNVAQFGPDCEAYLTLVARPTDTAYLLLRVGGSLSTPNAYLFGINGAGSGIHTLSRIDNGVPTQLGVTFAQALAVGDSLGISAVGSTISAFYMPNGGSWTLLASRVDATYTNAGYLAIVSAVGGWKADNFGGGNVNRIAVNTLSHFEYTVDKRGNRTQALEVLANLGTTTDTTIASTDKGLALTGTWTNVSGFKESVQTTAVLKLIFLSNLATLTMGKGPDHSQYDLYIDGVFWQTVDGYAATATQVDITIPTATLVTEGPHTLEVRNKNAKNASSSGFKVRFKQLLVVDKTWTQQNIKYSYDKLARVLEARYCPGLNLSAVDADLQRRYLYTYDRMHNRLTESLAINGGAPTVKTLTYNAANQISTAGYAYDNNGNLTSDGTNSYTWDRANRLLSMGGSTYKYDGQGNRIQQVQGGNTSKYLLDLNSSLPTVLAETIGASVSRFIHSLRGLHQLKTAAGVWEHILPDALGSLRVVTDNAVAVLESRNYGVYGDVFGTTGTSQTQYGYTGEPTDANGLVYDRARYMSPAIGQFISLDPKETFNRYAYVDGNPVMRIDPSGLMMDAGGGGGTPSPTASSNPVISGVVTGAVIGNAVGGVLGAVVGGVIGGIAGAIFGGSSTGGSTTSSQSTPASQQNNSGGSGGGSSGFGGGGSVAVPIITIRRNVTNILNFLDHVISSFGQGFNGGYPPADTGASSGGGSSGGWDSNNAFNDFKQNAVAPIAVGIMNAWADLMKAPLLEDIRNSPRTGIALLAGAGIGLGILLLAATGGAAAGLVPLVQGAMQSFGIGTATYVAGTSAGNIIKGRPIFAGINITDATSSGYTSIVLSPVNNYLVSAGAPLINQAAAGCAVNTGVKTIITGQASALDCVAGGMGNIAAINADGGVSGLVTNGVRNVFGASIGNSHDPVMSTWPSIFFDSLLNSLTGSG